MGRRKLGKLFPCHSCSKPVFRSPADQKKSKSGRFYCSKSCRRTQSQKRYARQMANSARARGKIADGPCVRCGSKLDVQMHHHDYEKPLDVTLLCRKCHDVEHVHDRRAAIESRRKYMEPCECGNAVAARGMCRACYARWRAALPAKQCVVPGCKSKAYTRGLCGKHRQQDAAKQYQLPKQKPGPKTAC